MKLEELVIGNRYSLSDLTEIEGTALILKKSSMDYSTGDPIGELIYIGEDFVGKVPDDDIVYIYNFIGESEEGYCPNDFYEEIY